MCRKTGKCHISGSFGRRSSVSATRFLSIRGFIVWHPCCSPNSAMRYYMHGGPARFRFELAGDLNAGDASRLEQVWRRVSRAMGKCLLVVDVSFVTGIDEAARSLFKCWHARGAEFAASSKQSRELVESITESPYTGESPHEPTYQPWFSYAKV
jgi:hypothetical protein